LPADVPVVFALLAGILGLLIGSFLNVCIYRVPRDISVIAPRSFCPECGASISWFDNIPVLSFLFLQGRCRGCGEKIGWRYPLVELATAVLFYCVVSTHGLTLVSLKWMVFEAILVVLFVTDLEERILPDELTIGGSVAGLVFAFFVPVPGFAGEELVPGRGSVVPSLVNAAAGACALTIPLAIFVVAYERLRGRRMFGTGDYKLLALTGIFLGLESGVSALFAAAIGGSLLGLIYISLKQKKASTYELPFGSFMCVSAGLVALLPERFRVV
jgi:leader peptidase (prepilin peptidase)/N-methyltransferase